METQTPWTVSAPAPMLNTGLDAVTLVDGTTFVVSAGSGDVRGVGHHGLFLSDTRIMRRFELLVNDHPVEPLGVVPNGPFSAGFVGRVSLTHPQRADDAHPLTSTLVVVRRRHVGRGMREDIELRNAGPHEIDVDVALAVDSDFASLFDVKEGRPPGDGTPPSELHEISGGIELTRADREVGLRVVAEPMPENMLSWRVRLGPASRWRACVEVSAHVRQHWLTPSYRCGDEIGQAIPVKRLLSWRGSAPRLVTADRALNQAFDRSIEDLGALRLFDPDHPERVVVAAGAPWFMTLFGRDSLITAWMALIADHSLARGVLRALSELQGTGVNEATEEQPGRILHEVRYDEVSARLLGGHNIYYGTADATPLFVMLTAELWRWSGDRADVDAFLPAVDRALEWIDRYGDRDGDGYVEYQRATPSGLANQGWKDSWDGVRYGDGSVAPAPIALCEVQAYVYGAYCARARLADVVGDRRGAAHWAERASELKYRFNRDFWLAEHGTFAIGLDSNKQRIDSVTSNPGHCLWTGIVETERAEGVARSLSSEEMASGFGVRTLAVTNPGFDPLSYHCGSVWPHDTAIAVAGLARYGFLDEAEQLAAALVDASVNSDGRLPELFAGFARDDLAAPIPYPTSCSPQAWAAGATLLIVRALLGIEPDGERGLLEARERAGGRFADLRIESVPVGSTRIDIA